MEIITIEDEDGFKTEHLWPEDKMLLSNGSFLEILEMRHNIAREEARRYTGLSDRDRTVD